MRIQEFKLDTGSWQTKMPKERAVLDSETGFERVFQAIQTERASSSPAAGVQTKDDGRFRTKAAERRSPQAGEKESVKKEEAPEAEIVSSKPVGADEQAGFPEAAGEVFVSEEQDVPAEASQPGKPEDLQSEEIMNPGLLLIPAESAVQPIPEILPDEEGMELEGMILPEELANLPEGEKTLSCLSAGEMEISPEMQPAVYEEGTVLLHSDPEAEAVNIPAETEDKPATYEAQKQGLPKRQPAVSSERSVMTEASGETAESADVRPVQTAEMLPNDFEMREKKPEEAKAVNVSEEEGMDAGNTIQDLPREDKDRVQAAMKVKPPSDEDSGNQQFETPLAEGALRQAASTKEHMNSTPWSQTPLESMIPVKTTLEALPASPSGKQQSQTLPELTVSHAVHAEKQAAVDIRKAGAAGKTGASDEAHTQANLDRVVKAAQTAVRGGSSRVQLRLDPPELGLLRVEIRQSASGLQLQMQATSTEAHQMLQKSSHELQAALEMQGLGTAKIEIQLRLDLRNETSEQGSSNGQSYPQPGQQEGQSQSFQSPFSQDFGSEYEHGGYDSGLESSESESPEAMLSGAGPGVGRGDGWQETQFHRLDVQV